MISLSHLIAGSREDTEAILIAHFVGTCRLCRAARPTSYALLCPAHLPLVRAVVDAVYVEGICREIDQLELRLQLLELPITDATDPVLLAQRQAALKQRLTQAYALLNRIHDASTDISAALEKAAAPQRGQSDPGEPPHPADTQAAPA